VALAQAGGYVSTLRGLDSYREHVRGLETAYLAAVQAHLEARRTVLSGSVGAGAGAGGDSLETLLEREREARAVFEAARADLQRTEEEAYTALHASLAYTLPPPTAAKRSRTGE
jgi:hypothetical protein